MNPLVLIVGYVIVRNTAVPTDELVEEIRQHVAHKIGPTAFSIYECAAAYAQFGPSILETNAANIGFQNSTASLYCASLSTKLA